MCQKIALHRGLMVYPIPSQPHSWGRLFDTRFTLAHLDESDIVVDDVGPTSTPLARLMGLSGDYIRSYTQAHSAHEHVKHPNALVLHHQFGIDILHIVTGQLLSRLKLEEARIHADVQYDFQVEKAYIPTPEWPNEGCDAVVEIGGTERIQEALCDTSETFYMSKFFSTSRKLIEDRTKLVTPVVVPR